MSSEPTSQLHTSALNTNQGNAGKGSAKASVVMVTYHTGPALWVAIHAVLKQSNLDELIIVNNGNPKRETARLEALARDDARVQLVMGQGNAGFARGCNLGAARASGDYILLLNPDALLPDDALSTLISALAAHPNAWLAGGVIINVDGKEQRASRRNALTPWSAISEALMLRRWWSAAAGINAEATPLPQETHAIPVISGACMLFPRARFEALGGMDEGYFLHVEDVDVCARIAEAGGEVLCVPAVRVTHLRSTSRASAAFVEWHKAKGFVRYFYRHCLHTQPLPMIWVVCALAYLRFAGKALAAPFLRLLPGHARAEDARMLAFRRAYDGLPETSALSGLNVLVSGARSQIGLMIIARLLRMGATVTALSRRPPVWLHHPRLHWHRADIEDIAPHSMASQDVLLHAAPLWLLPSVLPRLVALGIKRVVAFGSTSQFVKGASGNIEEQEIAERLAKAEATSHEASRALGLALTVFHPTLIYGAGLDQNISRLRRMIERFGRVPVYGATKGLRMPVHCDDLALAAISVLDQDTTFGKSYVLSGGETLSYRAMVERIFHVLEQPVKITRVPFLPWLLDMLGIALRKAHVNGEMARRMNQDLTFSHDDAARDFGYAPRPFLRDGIVDL